MRLTRETMDVQELYDKAFALRYEARYAEAKPLFEQILAANPAHSDSAWQIALIQGFEGDFFGSVEALDALVAQYPQNVNYRYDLAMSQMMVGMDDEACSNFREVLRLDPGHEKASQQMVYCN